MLKSKFNLVLHGYHCNIITTNKVSNAIVTNLLCHYLYLIYLFNNS